jgi:hypothetical protein
MYCGHLDTTYGGDEEGIRDLGPGYQPKSWIEGEWVYGLGSYNMKGGHASAILAVEALARSKAPMAIFAMRYVPRSQTAASTLRHRCCRAANPGAMTVLVGLLPSYSAASAFDRKTAGSMKSGT